MPALLEALASAYNLPTLSLQEKVSRGHLSDNHVLTTGHKKYFLKQWRFAKPDRIEIALTAEQYFGKYLPVIQALPTLQRERFFHFEKYYYSLYPYIAGTHIEREDVDGQALTAMAEFLAHLHLLSRNHPFTINRTFSWWHPESALPKMQHLLSILQALPAKTHFDRDAEEYLTRKLTLVQENTLCPEDLYLASDTVTHGDFHESNIFFEGTAVSQVFDFEKAEMAPRAIELIRCIHHTLFNGMYINRNFQRAKHFVQAYNSIYPIPASEVQKALKIWFTKGFHSHWIETNHYLEHNFRSDIFLESGLNALRYQTEHLSEIAEALTEGLA